MKKMKFLLVMVLFVASTAAFAQTGIVRVEKRQKAQKARIVQGRQDKEFTKGEIYVLNKEQRQIKKSVMIAKWDGVVSLREKRKLVKMQNQASGHFWKAKHNESVKKA